MPDLRNEVRHVLRSSVLTRVDIDSLDDSADLFESGLSSHASVELMLALEDAFDVEFPDRMLKRSVFRSISDIAGAVGELQKQVA